MLLLPAVAIVAAAGVFLLGLGWLALVFPVRAKRFLLGFAGSAQKHYLELCIRFVIGTAMLVAAPRMAGTAMVDLVGWTLIGTTALMLLVPWRIHQAFAQRVVPIALGYLPLMGLASIAGGLAILGSVYLGLAGALL